MVKKRKVKKKAAPSNTLEVLFTPRLAEGLRAAAADLETNRSQVVRDAVKKYLEENHYIERQGLGILGRTRPS